MNEVYLRKLIRHNFVLGKGWEFSLPLLSNVWWNCTFISFYLIRKNMNMSDDQLLPFLISWILSSFALSLSFISPPCLIHFKIALMWLNWIRSRLVGWLC